MINRRIATAIIFLSFNLNCFFLYSDTNAQYKPDGNLFTMSGGYGYNILGGAAIEHINMGISFTLNNKIGLGSSVVEFWPNISSRYEHWSNDVYDRNDPISKQHYIAGEHTFLTCGSWFPIYIYFYPFARVDRQGFSNFGIYSYAGGSSWGKYNLFTDDWLKGQFAYLNTGITFYKTIKRYFKFYATYGFLMMNTGKAEKLDYSVVKSPWQVTHYSSIYSGEKSRHQYLNLGVELAIMKYNSAKTKPVPRIYPRTPEYDLIVSNSKIIVNDGNYGLTSGNGNGKIEPGETVQITLFVENLTATVARDITLRLNDLNPYTYLKSGQQIFEIDRMNPHDTKEISFLVQVYETFNYPTFPISIDLFARDSAYSKSFSLLLPFERHYDVMVDVDANIPRTNQTNENGIAVIIGNKNYQKTGVVNFAINDAMAIKKYLIHTLGYKEGNIYLLTDATKAEFDLYFGIADNHRGKLFNAVRKDVSDVFIYYSGHGAPSLNSKRAYFVPVDCDPQYVELNGYSVDVFYSNLYMLPARSLTVIIDACFSGARVLDNISPVLPVIDNPLMIKENSIVMTSSTGSQVSSWYTRMKHGLFTYFFLKAMVNRNADANNDGNLTFEEIYHYVADHNNGVPYFARFLNNVDQTPTIKGKSFNRIFVTY